MVKRKKSMASNSDVKVATIVIALFVGPLGYSLCSQRERKILQRPISIGGMLSHKENIIYKKNVLHNEAKSIKKIPMWSVKSLMLRPQ